MATYNIWSVKDLQIIINHFDKYPLITAKLSDYLLFKQCFEIIKKKEHLTEKGFLKILKLKSSLTLGFSDKLKKSFPPLPSNTPPLRVFGGVGWGVYLSPKKDKYTYTFYCIPDPYWVAGFTSGDGSFNLHVSEHNSTVSKNVHRKVVLKYAICLHRRDEEVIKGLITYFKSLDNNKISDEEFKDTSDKSLLTLSNHIYKTETTVTLYFWKFSDIVNIIIPFFEKFSIEGQKKLDFEDFKLVAEIVKHKEHLTQEGYNRIVKINSTMNLRRPWS